MDCLQSEILGGIREGLGVQPISPLYLGYVIMYKTAHHSNDILADK